jgi:hypothetical protein
MRSAAAASSVAFIDCTGLVSFGMDPVVSSFLPCCPAQAESDSATIATATPVARRHRDKEKVSCIVIEAPAIQSCTGTPDKSGATFTPAIIC